MKYLLLTALATLLNSCGSGLEYDGPNSRTYTYILTNQTGIELIITSDFGRTELVSTNDSYQCQIDVEDDYSGGLCSLELEIRIPETNKGYRCFGLASDVEELCFVDDFKLFTISEGTIFTETKTRTYEYVLTPDLLENAFELPQ
ncbi:hypothetical protein EZV76_05310 [Flagellimonas alvinocaridis]|uniref:Uncharacterized protein n=1 Tax=Flagellimonas alvinocaridis TaxID=2530200 RepID=A0A4S8RPA7_9FLAO|nr:hypothetical protein [Allomuricauda alvinocaridis]THV59980.1 hypothetical protein EZV76_05310 [Allomuricauda alvinocaridis]